MNYTLYRKICQYLVIGSFIFMVGGLSIAWAFPDSLSNAEYMQLQEDVVNLTELFNKIDENINSYIYHNPDTLYSDKEILEKIKMMREEQLETLKKLEIVKNKIFEHDKGDLAAELASNARDGKKLLVKIAENREKITRLKGLVSPNHNDLLNSIKVARWLAEAEPQYLLLAGINRSALEEALLEINNGNDAAKLNFKKAGAILKAAERELGVFELAIDKDISVDDAINLVREGLNNEVFAAGGITIARRLELEGFEEGDALLEFTRETGASILDLSIENPRTDITIKAVKGPEISNFVDKALAGLLTEQVGKKKPKPEPLKIYEPGLEEPKNKNKLKGGPPTNKPKGSPPTLPFKPKK